MAKAEAIGPSSRAGHTHCKLAATGLVLPRRCCCLVLVRGLQPSWPALPACHSLEPLAAGLASANHIQRRGRPRASARDHPTAAAKSPTAAITPSSSVSAAAVVSASFARLRVTTSCTTVTLASVAKPFAAMAGMRIRPSATPVTVALKTPSFTAKPSASLGRLELQPGPCNST